MGGGGGSDVKNAVWMRALIMAGMILGFAVVSYIGLGVVVADMKHHTWEDEEDHYYEAKKEWQDAVDAGEIKAMTRMLISTRPRKKPIITRLMHISPTLPTELLDWRFSLLELSSQPSWSLVES